MDVIKGLKYALVLVLVTSAVLLGWTTYLRSNLDAKVTKFQTSMGQAKSEAEAKQVIKNFMADINFDPVAQSASADSYPCEWLCEQDSGESQRTIPDSNPFGK